eukprot:m.58465 g.58465  ORF g.58465 m.58465 type:complete len:823 (-) comp7864_c1_seq1:140-2608(-)
MQLSTRLIIIISLSVVVFVCIIAIIVLIRYLKRSSSVQAISAQIHDEEGQLLDHSVLSHHSGVSSTRSLKTLQNMKESFQPLHRVALQQSLRDFVGESMDNDDGTFLIMNSPNSSLLNNSNNIHNRTFTSTPTHGHTDDGNRSQVFRNSVYHHNNYSGFSQSNNIDNISIKSTNNNSNSNSIPIFNNTNALQKSKIVTPQLMYQLRRILRPDDEFFIIVAQAEPGFVVCEPRLVTFPYIEGHDGLGLTLSGSQPVRITNIDDGSPADFSEATLGDCLIEVNGHFCAEDTHHRVIALMTTELNLMRLMHVDQPVELFADDGMDHGVLPNTSFSEVNEKIDFVAPSDIIILNESPTNDGTVSETESVQKKAYKMQRVATEMMARGDFEAAERLLDQALSVLDKEIQEDSRSREVVSVGKTKKVRRGDKRRRKPNSRDYHHGSSISPTSSTSSAAVHKLNSISIQARDADTSPTSSMYSSTTTTTVEVMREKMESARKQLGLKKRKHDESETTSPRSKSYYPISDASEKEKNRAGDAMNLRTSLTNSKHNRSNQSAFSKTGSSNSMVDVLDMSSDPYRKVKRGSNLTTSITAPTKHSHVATSKHKRIAKPTSNVEDICLPQGTVIKRNKDKQHASDTLFRPLHCAPLSPQKVFQQPTSVFRKGKKKTTYVYRPDVIIPHKPKSISFSAMVNVQPFTASALSPFKLHHDRSNFVQSQTSSIVGLRKLNLTSASTHEADALVEKRQGLESPQFSTHVDDEDVFRGFESDAEEVDGGGVGKKKKANKIGGNATRFPNKGKQREIVNKLLDEKELEIKAWMKEDSNNIV